MNRADHLARNRARRRAERLGLAPREDDRGALWTITLAALAVALCLVAWGPEVAAWLEWALEAGP